MKETSEISALFTLLDDPDKEVFSTVGEKIVSFGRPILPNLENLWETTPDEEVQKRVQLLIGRLHFRNLQDELAAWNLEPEKDLLTGTLLVSRLVHPELSLEPVRHSAEKIRQSIWLELNNYLTPLETTNVISTVLYNFHGLKGMEALYTDPDNFLVNKLLETKKGSAASLGTFYLSICEMLNIPIRAINIPNQFILAYFNESLLESPAEEILFFIDPLGGQIYTYEDVEAYFRRASLELTASCLQPMRHTDIIQFQLNELAKCYSGPYEKEKQEQAVQLSHVLSR